MHRSATLAEDALGDNVHQWDCTCEHELTPLEVHSLKAHIYGTYCVRSASRVSSVLVCETVNPNLGPRASPVFSGLLATYSTQYADTANLHNNMEVKLTWKCVINKPSVFMGEHYLGPKRDSIQSGTFSYFSSLLIQELVKHHLNRDGNVLL